VINEAARVTAPSRVDEQRLSIDRRSAQLNDVLLVLSFDDILTVQELANVLGHERTRWDKLLRDDSISDWALEQVERVARHEAVAARDARGTIEVVTHGAGLSIDAR
jgi:hypothetical protein